MQKGQNRSFLAVDRAYTPICQPASWVWVPASVSARKGLWSWPVRMAP